MAAAMLRKGDELLFGEGVEAAGARPAASFGAKIGLSSPSLSPPPLRKRDSIDISLAKDPVAALCIMSSKEGSPTISAAGAL